MPEMEILQPKSMETIGLQIYLAGVLILPFLFILLNRCFKWMTKEDIGDNNAGLIIIATILIWPMFLIIGFIFLLLNLFSKLAFPPKS